MVLSLYDSQRLQKPFFNGQGVKWAGIDESIRRELAQISDNVYVLSRTVTSPTTRAVIDQFLRKFKSSAHVEYDPVSYSAILDAHEQTFNSRVLPHYRFDRAEVIVSFDADFLGTWISPVEFTKAYTSARGLERDPARLSRHVQLEGRLSITGSNADVRIKVTPRECRRVLMDVSNKLAEKSGDSPPCLKDTSHRGVDDRVISEITDELWNAKGKSLVVCGLNDVRCQELVNYINHVLGNYGATLNIGQPSLQWNGRDLSVIDLVKQMEAGRVNALLIADVNPAYSLPNAEEFIRALKRVPLTVSFADHFDETAELTRYVCPLPHFLESWNDAELGSGVISMSQPAIPLMEDARSLREALAAWTGTPRSDLEILQDHWRKEIFPRQNRESSFERFWDQAVEEGWTTVEPKETNIGAFRILAGGPPDLAPPSTAGQYALVLYEKASMRDGRHAHNPWLQELPDPVTKAVWDNYVCLAPSAARKLSIESGDLVEVSCGQLTVELPAQIQPGQHEQVAGIALGYGRRGTDRFSRIGPQWIQGEATVKEGETVGKNAFRFAAMSLTNILFENTVSIKPTGKKTDLAITQTHHSVTVPEHLGGQRRNLVRETTLSAFLTDPASGNHYEHQAPELWDDDHMPQGHRWGMAIDLNRCTGCSACIIGCQAENNIPVVGKDEVHRHREMHWIRVDRYYSGDDEHVDVMHQPVMCQHCGHAPCETVCPVLATVHSSEGLNQQVYNRCVGTRYCANNCPYKVRRFNWFNYRQEDQKENLVLNPDVTARTRGVMEKCSFCVQRIQETKAEAKRLGLPIRDGDIKVACQQSCPAEAIVFGDLNDPQSQVAKLASSPRHYHMLEEMNFRPAVGYLTKVRNRKDPG
jgi:molybdopterin-containing oxidoreductase family iron-sulfur binding subunit